jgi:hypothetical protein
MTVTGTCQEMVARAIHNFHTYVVPSGFAKKEEANFLCRRDVMHRWKVNTRVFDAWGASKSHLSRFSAESYSLTQLHENLAKNGGKEKTESRQHQNEIAKDKKKEYYREYNRQNEAKRRESKRAYHHLNKDKISAAKRHYRLQNIDQIKETKRRYHLQHKDKLNQAARAYHLAHQDDIRAAKRRYRLKKHVQPDSYVPRTGAVKSWKTPAQVREYFEAISTPLRVAHFTDWYRISRVQIQSLEGVLFRLDLMCAFSAASIFFYLLILYSFLSLSLFCSILPPSLLPGGTLFAKFGSLASALQFAYPDVEWDASQFAHRRKKSEQRLLRVNITELVPGIEVVEDYHHPDLCWGMHDCFPVPRSHSHD